MEIPESKERLPENESNWLCCADSLFRELGTEDSHLDSVEDPFEREGMRLTTLN